MKKFSLSTLALAVISANLANADTTKVKKPIIVEEEILVVGFRGSIQNALDTKQKAQTIVESVYATDIGKLPDSSIAESISRLPGVAAQRLDGRASSITIRGLGEHFNPATMNGREQVSLNDNRGIEFDIYPSEVVNQVVVHKTPEAKLINQGIGGTIDLKTTRPLHHGERTFSVNVRGEKNDIGALNVDGEDVGTRYSATYIDQFANETVGISIAYASMESPNNEERWNSWGWNSDANGDLILNGAKPYVRSSLLKRDTTMATLEFKPNDKIHFTIDAVNIDFSDEKLLRGVEIPMYNNGANDGLIFTTAESGVVTSGVINNAEIVMRNDYEERDATLQSYGINILYEQSDSLHWTFDYSKSSVERDVIALESYAGTGRGTNNGETVDILFNVKDGQEGVSFTAGNFDETTGEFFVQENYFNDLNRFLIGGPLSWGGGHPFRYQNRDDASAPVCNNFSDGNCYRNNAQDGFLNTPSINDELSTMKLAGEVMFEDGPFSSVEFGLNINDRTKSKLDKAYFLTLPGVITNIDQFSQNLESLEYGAALDSAQFNNNYMLAVPEQYQLGSASLGFIGLGDMIAYDSLAFWQDGNYFSLEEVSASDYPSRSSNSWTVNEKVTTLFLQGNIDSYLGTNIIRGNVGLQLVHTDQRSSGTSARVNEDGSVTESPVNNGTSYIDILPSANVVIELNEDHQVRLGYARTLARSRMDRLKVSYGYARNQFGNYTGEGGNPSLRPNLANQLDTGYEWYFSSEGYLSVSAFYKQLDEWQVIEQNDQLTNQVWDELNAAGISTNYVEMVQWDTTSGGSIQGAELTVALPAHMLSEALDGFGVVASASRMSSEVEIDDIKQSVTGLSEDILNATFYYENHGFEFRTSLRKRSDFLGEVNGLSFVRVPVTVKGSSVWDAQMSYDLTEVGIDGLSVSFQVQNLTDEPFVTTNNNDDRQVRDYQRFGKNYLLGVSYKF